MHLDKLLYRSFAEGTVDAADRRSDIPFRITMSQDTVLVLRRVNFVAQPVQGELISADTYSIAAAISSADLTPALNVAETRAHIVYMNRNDFVVAHMWKPVVQTSTGVFGSHFVEYLFEPDQIVLPRSPTLVVAILTSGLSDDWDIECNIYYEKKKVSSNEMLKLMTRYKSVKPASIPRVIDE